MIGTGPPAASDLETEGTGESRHCDVLVYGATAGGVIAAVAAAGEGMRVVLLAADRHIGGMVTGGLGKTDMERQERVIGGLARQFFEEAGAAYDEPVAWRFEPSVAMRVLRRWLDVAGVEVHLDAGLPEVERRGSAIRRVTAGSDRYAAGVFIDASYEGDLLAVAGVSHRTGREDRDLHGESLAGRREFLPGPHQFRVPVSPDDADGHLLPYVTAYDSVAPVGHGDGLMQAYCFRLCLTDRPASRIPIDAPYGYDRRRFGLAAAYVRALGDRATLRDLIGIGRVPGGKTDVNSDGPVSTNLPGANREYVQADPDTRRAIHEEHRTWAHGLLWFLANEPDVPPRLRREAAAFGLPGDEFAGSSHWPPQLYVREARRTVGSYVITQRDLQVERTKPDAIGMGGYNIDIREVQWVAVDVYRFPDISRETLTEGYVSVPVEPYQIPYRSLLPRPDECSNLLVSACVSASHVAFASLRLEPQFMIMGHACGVAAAQAVRAGVAPAGVDIGELHARLTEQGQVLGIEELGGDAGHPEGRRPGIGYRETSPR